jgi:hypothetical protein
VDIQQSKPPKMIDALLYLSPLLVLYEFAAFTYTNALLSARYPKPFLFQLVGLDTKQILLVNGLLLIVFCLVVAALYEASEARFISFLSVALEGLLWGVALLVLQVFFRARLFSVGLGHPWLLFAGSGFYDELAFQWLLPSVIISCLRLLPKIKKSIRTGLGIGLSVGLYVVLCSVHSHLPTPLLLVRGVGALFVTALARYRGFPCAAYAQLCYVALGSFYF